MKKMLDDRYSDSESDEDKGNIKDDEELLSSRDNSSPELFSSSGNENSYEIETSKKITIKKGLPVE